MADRVVDTFGSGMQYLPIDQPILPTGKHVSGHLRDHITRSISSIQKSILCIQQVR